MVVHELQAQNLSMRPAAPLSSYIAVSLSNVIATTCQYEALKHVTFPVQTLGKCAKMIPVMAWGTLISHKAYSAKDFCVAALVTAGCTCFLLSGKAASKGANQSSYLGFTCMLVYLAFDGFTATFQVCSCRTPPYPGHASLPACTAPLPLEQISLQLTLLFICMSYYLLAASACQHHLQSCCSLRGTSMLTKDSIAAMLAERARMQKEQI